MDALTINEAAETTGWSPRMLRYVESMGLIESDRSPAGYRLYGPEQLQRLRTLRELLDGYDVGLVGDGLRIPPAPRRGPVRGGGGVVRGQAERPDDVAAADWLRFEQEKHQRLLEAALS